MYYGAPLCLKCKHFTSPPHRIGGDAICKKYPKKIPKGIFFEAKSCQYYTPKK